METTLGSAQPPESAGPVATQANRIFTAPAGTGEAVTGRTLISLLDEACSLQNNPKAFNQRTAEGWQALSHKAFRSRAEHMALGLLDLGLERGDRVGMFVESDLSFCLADIACLTAGLVDVPVYLTHTDAAILHIMKESEAKALVVTNEDLLEQITPLLSQMPELKAVIMFEMPVKNLPILPEGVELKLYSDLEKRGVTIDKTDPERIKLLKAQIGADDLATLIYTSGTTGLPKGVMLTHENISSNAIAAMTGLSNFTPGEEVALSFLPLTHIFARTLQYCMIWFGAAVYFSHPDRLSDDLKDVQPTFFASVPRVLEKAYEKILAKGAELSGTKKKLFDWALHLAQNYDVESPHSGLDAVKLKVADALVLSKWRAALGGKVHTVVVGGAAMRPDLVNTLGGAGIQILQGYGLTETSPVIAFNRPGRNRAGTVGEVLAGAEVKISDEGEILSRGPHIMRGYYQQPEKTAEVIKDGWFHTGDMGEMDSGGYLKITGRIKNLFKLSTGKYVMPQPLEDRLEAHSLIATALVVGEGEKYCSAVIFANPELCKTKAELEPQVEQLKTLVQEANKDLPHWSNIKRVAFIAAELTPENGLLTPKLSVKRSVVLRKYAAYVERLYDKHDDKLPEGAVFSI